AIFGPAPASPPTPVVSRDQDFEAFRKSLQDIAGEIKLPERLARILSTVTESDVQEAFNKAPKLDQRLSEWEKAAIYKMMVSEALANFKERAGERSGLDVPLSGYFDGLAEPPAADAAADFTLVQINPALSGNSRLFKLPKEKARTLESLTLREKPGERRPGPLAVPDSKGWLLTAPREYFYRDAPYPRMLAVAAQLFYIVKGFPELAPSGTSADSGSGKAEPSPQNPPNAIQAEDKALPFKVIYIPSRGIRESGRPVTGARPPLALTMEKANGILDYLMAFPDGEQVRIFNRDYLERYDPESPDLARLTRDFIYRNLGMVFMLGDPLSRGFDFLEEIYFDNISQDELVEYWLNHPRSRTGAEILFCLAASYEFERRAIIALDGSVDAAKSVLADPSEDGFHVYNRSAKSYVLKEVYDDLARELRRRGYASLESVLQKYKDEQLGIYRLLMDMGGDTKSRAQYALGGFYWDEGRADLAMKTWKDIVPSFSTRELNSTRTAMEEIRDPLRLISQINEILARHAASNRGGLLQRIKNFHKWEKRSAGVRGR
ncbi:MAG: hypothetical protein ABSG19_14220, partial [Candidatus Aminicenantales bacterium]